MSSFTNRSISATAAIVATLVTFAATAAPVRAETYSTQVRYADLNLSTPAGRATLQRRIHHAADVVCGEGKGYDRLTVQSCRSKAIQGAQADARLASTASQGNISLAAR